MKSVLIVDDAIFVRHTLREMLEKNDFEVIGEAEDGMNALMRYKELKPDIVTMDINMPEIGGIEAVQLIKKADPDAHIVMVTSTGQERLIRDAIVAGAQGFLVKPFNEDDVIRALNNL